VSELKVRPVRYGSGAKVETLSFPDGIEIVADDGRTLFSIRQAERGIEVSSAGTCRHGGIVLDSVLTIKPEASNLVLIQKAPFK